MDDVTQAVWVTRQATTVRHLRGVLDQLEAAHALDYANVRIMTVEEDRAVTLPGGRLFTLDTLPAEGVLVIGE